MLVDYSDSDDEESPSTLLPVFSASEENKKSSFNNKSSGSKKPDGKLPLPDTIQSMFGARQKELPVEDESGKIRNFPHVRGNWASLLYLPVSQNQERILELLADRLLELDQATDVQFEMVDHFHISLSRTFVVRHHWIDSLFSELQQSFSTVSCFSCSLGPLKLYCNDEKTRSFIGITVTLGSERLNECVQNIDAVLQSYRIPVYYQNPSFHLSILWSPGDITGQLSDEKLQVMNSTASDFITLHPEVYTIKARQLCFKTGNKLYNLPLKGSL